MPETHKPLDIVGYSHVITTRPGETVPLYVSCSPERSDYRVDLVRLRSGDTEPGGPGLKEEVIETNLSGRSLHGFEQVTTPGSYGYVRHAPPLALDGSLSLCAFIYPTALAGRVQALIAKWNARTRSGYALVIDEAARLQLWLGGGSYPVAQVGDGEPLVQDCWYFVSASYDRAQGRAAVCGVPWVTSTNSRRGPFDALETWESRVDIGAVDIRHEEAVPLTFAAWCQEVESNEWTPGALFNGKIEAPLVASRALSVGEMLLESENPAPAHVVGAWDFSAEVTEVGVVPHDRISDTTANRLDGTLVNLPARAIRGRRWSGRDQRAAHAPKEYAAIHFHADDLEDAGWTVSCELDLPADLRSGIYAARLRSPTDEDYVPFFVRPKTPSAAIALLVPTFSYLAYGNSTETLDDADESQLVAGGVQILDRMDLELNARAERYGLSLYNTHVDGSPVLYASWRRPLLTNRPKRRYPIARVWQFNADLHVTDWLEEKGFEYDVLTDHDLHAEGVSALREYSVVLTGTHPEYYSEAMLDALEAYVAGAGHLMYLGGNGFYWVTAPHPTRPEVIEVRRWAGTQTYVPDPGEQYLSFTGEYGGLWLHRGRPPHKLAGVGFIAQGLDVSAPYVRNADSMREEVRELFEGIESTTIIGDFGLVGGGAAGLEIDSYDAGLGSPLQSLMLASSQRHSGNMLKVRESFGLTRPDLGGDENPDVRADLVYFEVENGGAVFSTGSIAWCGALSCNGYENDVARLTENVLARFVAGPIGGR